MAGIVHLRSHAPTQGLECLTQLGVLYHHKFPGLRAHRAGRQPRQLQKVIEIFFADFFGRVVRARSRTEMEGVQYLLFADGGHCFSFLE